MNTDLAHMKTPLEVLQETKAPFLQKEELD